MTTWADITSKGKRPLPKGWQWVRLKDAVQLNPRRPGDLRRADDAATSFVPMEAVDEVTGTIAKRITRHFGEIKQGYTYFAEGDVLFAKITPCMQNGKHAIARGLTDGIGFGTTEFHVLRPGPPVIAEWIHYFVRQPALLLEATEHFTGAVGQQRLPADYLANLDFPLPPLDEQKRITAILNEQVAAVERARKAGAESEIATGALFSAYLRSVFSPENLKRWPKREFGDIAQVTARQVDPTLPEYRDMPHVNGENIESGTCRITYLPTAAEERMTSGKYLFDAGSVLYSKLRPYLRKVTYVDFRGLCSADMYPIEVDRKMLAPRFAAWMLLSEEFTNYAVNQSQRARMPKLNRDQLFSWEAPVPPLEEQKALIGRLESQMSQVQCLAEKVKQQNELMEHFPAALLRKAFAGEL